MRWAFVETSQEEIRGGNNESGEKRESEITDGSRYSGIRRR